VTKKQKIKTKIELQIPFSISYKNERREKEMTIKILLSKVVGKRKTKIKVEIPFSM